MQDAHSIEALPGAQEDQALSEDSRAQQHHGEMQSQLIAAQYLPDSYQQQCQQPSPTEAHQFQGFSRLPKPQLAVPESQVQVNQPYYSSESPGHDQPSCQQVSSQQQVSAPPVASAGMVNGRDQYEVLRLQSSLIPRQSHPSLTVPSQAHLPYQAMPQPQFVQSVSYKSACAASAISCQTPQAVSASQSASQYDSVTVRHSSGHALTNKRHQEGQRSMHHQHNAGVMQDNGAVDGQGRAEQEQPCDGHQPAILDCRVQAHHGIQGQGFQAERQQPCSVTATHQQRLTEHTVSRSPDGNSVTESQTVSSSSSHYEFSFRHDTSGSTLPRSGISVCTFACRPDCCCAAPCLGKDAFALNPQCPLFRLLLTDSTTCKKKVSRILANHGAGHILSLKCMFEHARLDVSGRGVTARLRDVCMIH